MNYEDETPWRENKKKKKCGKLTRLEVNNGKISFYKIARSNIVEKV